VERSLPAEIEKPQIYRAINVNAVKLFKYPLLYYRNGCPARAFRILLDTHPWEKVGAFDSKSGNTASTISIPIWL
jgi:hypothetical protein